jgi:hypothetical protein
MDEIFYVGPINALMLIKLLMTNETIQHGKDAMKQT